ncbi:hypothetical protein ACT453_55500, partial [Bacillus sp. D-CC]
IPVIAEGNFDTPEKARKALEMGAYSVVVGILHFSINVESTSKLFIFLDCSVYPTNVVPTN